MSRHDHSEAALSEFRRLIRDYRFKRLVLTMRQREQLIAEIRRAANFARNHGVPQEEIDRTFIHEIWRPIF